MAQGGADGKPGNYTFLLMELHIGYETVELRPLERLGRPDEKARAAGVSPKAILKASEDAA